MSSRLASILLLLVGLGNHACQARLWNAFPGLVINDNAPYTPLVNKPVPFEAHIMSKCPDARDALQQLVIPVMQRVYDKVDFTLSYIGRSTANDGVSCLHGPSECMGNILELCARELYPDPKINLGFVMCLSKDYQDIPDRSLIADCALEHAVSLEDLNECATRDDGAHGLELLHNSVKHSADVRSSNA
ncbi:Gamma-interferon-inducible lysosomal thiol reductase [Escovopsis weberi]|uniref:Gamma-interferon-inducible lysosomal thiol reductase n=1 Tax=Escovopsis weberi TaxID=150374 RepID=A0A0M9VT42_ESCWE|nr:Gamma-interferon-inducible lysosomal thiol reductase [Escovopsis weberi]